MLVAISLWSADAALAARDGATQRAGQRRCTGTSLLESPRCRSRVRTVRRLLRSGAAVNEKDAEGWTPLLRVLTEKRVAVAKLLVRRGADPNAVKPGVPRALDIAMARRDFALVALLTAQGARWEAASPVAQLERPVAAAIGADLSFLAWMVEHRDAGALDARDDEGRTLLHRAAAAGNAIAVHQLLGAGASVDAASRGPRSGEGWTALMYAAAADQIATIRRLVGKGADVDHRNASGRSALHFAVAYGHGVSARLLLDLGAHRDVADAAGVQPAEIAEDLGGVTAVAAFAVPEQGSSSPAAAKEDE